MNPVFPVLYSRTSTGAVQTWRVVVDGDSFHSISGQVDGKQTVSAPTICKPKNVGKKNETSGAEQAQLEAAAKHKKKIESGYKENIKDIDNSTFVEPMLAKEFDDRIKDIDALFAKGTQVYHQPKLDGMRCIVSKEGMFSRNGKPILSSPHIFESLKHLFKDEPTLVFDGELYADKLSNDFNTLMSLAKQLKPTAEDFARSKETLEYHVYDLVDSRLVFSCRQMKLAKLLQDNDLPYIKKVFTGTAGSYAELDEAYGEYLESGYEGQMVRINEPYENKRSKYLLKRKVFIRKEYPVDEICEGVGIKAGKAAYAWCHTEEGKKFKSNIRGNHAFCTELWKNKAKFENKPATIEFFNLTPDGIPRFPYIVEFDRQDV
jgi:DNA ligase 1